MINKTFTFGLITKLCPMKIVHVNTIHQSLISRSFLLLFLFLPKLVLHAESQVFQDSIPTKIYEIVDEEPSFQGGFDAFSTFFSKNFRFPAALISGKESGIVKVKFIVTKGGTVLEPKIQKGIGPESDEEMLRLFRMMPKWKPAQLNGKAVDAYGSFTIDLTLKPDNPGDLNEVVVEEPPMPFFESAALPIKNNDEVLKVVEQMPAFAEGQVALLKFLKQNIMYPQIAKENGVEGMVVVQMIVERDGALSNVHVIKGIGAGCDEEALRVVKMMPKWKPGFQKGQAVRVQFNLPIRFKPDN
jgi:TonB family protein